MSTATKKRNNCIMALEEMFGNNENATTEVVTLAPILVKALNDIENGKIEKQTEAPLVNVKDEFENERKKIEIIKEDKKTEKNMRNLHYKIIGGNARNQEKNNDKERE